MPMVALGLPCFLPSRADGDSEPMSVVLLRIQQNPGRKACQEVRPRSRL